VQFVNQFEVPASLEDAWTHLADVPLIAPCLPGATVRQLSEDTYEGEVSIKVGPIRAGYTGQATVVRRDDEAHVMVLDAQGKEGKGKGSAAATITLEMRAASPGVSVAQVTTYLTITGRLAQFGRSAMADVSERLMAQFADNLAAQIQATGGPSVAAPSDTGSSPSTDPAASFASGSSATAGAAASSELDAMTFMLPLLKRAAPAAAAAAAGLLIGMALGGRRGRRRASDANPMWTSAAAGPPRTDLPWPGCRH